MFSVELDWDARVGNDESGSRRISTARLRKDQKLLRQLVNSEPSRLKQKEILKPLLSVSTCTDCLTLDM